MAKVITFSRVFPSYHPKAGQPTYFVEKFWESLITTEQISLSRCCELSRQTGIGGYTMNTIRKKVFNPKHHTIRAGHRFKAGDYFSPRVWSGKPYNSKQIQFAPDVQVKNVWDFKTDGCDFYLNGELAAYASSPSELFLTSLAENDGLNEEDLLAWFQYPKEFAGQIICWNENIEY